jgi:endonuclease/exonuclease/phosphatase family metal-dependent hydrolase
MKNKKGKSIIGWVLLLIVLGGVVYTAYEKGVFDDLLNTNQTQTTQNTTFTGDTIKIANWNLQIFGDSKVDLIDTYANKIKNYDIIFIQEIRDEDGSSFVQLCERLPDYDCKVSSRAGRSSSKEQYGIIYRKNIQVIAFKDYNPDSLDRWERPPIRVLFNVSNFVFSVYNIHIKPDDVQKELSNLQNEIYEFDNLIILGDLNADCDYYNPVLNTEFDNWFWLIKDSDDTTVSASSCAYDRILVTPPIQNQYVSYGIDKEGITKEVSDHYLVWVEIAI